MRRDALQAYPTSIDEDLALLRDLSPGTRQHKAVQVWPNSLRLALLQVAVHKRSVCQHGMLHPPIVAVSCSQENQRHCPLTWGGSFMQVRLGEKESLDSALSFFESRQQRLDDLEYYQERRLKRLGLLDDTGGSTYDDFFKVRLTLCT